LFANPREATKGYLEIAHDEDARKSALRHTLNDGRHKNIERADALAKKQSDHMRAGSAHGANRKPAPRQIIHPRHSSRPRERQ
jgi:hypothetical protein